MSSIIKATKHDIRDCVKTERFAIPLSPVPGNLCFCLKFRISRFQPANGW